MRTQTADFPLERVQIVDRLDRPLTGAPRREMRKLNLVHRAAYILVLDTQGHLFIHKRTMNKDVYPGYWDMTVGGVVLEGESYEEAALRELHEELGIRDIPLRALFAQYYEDAFTRTWGRVFACRNNGPFALQAEEIDEGRFVAFEAIDALRQEHPFTPDCVPLLKRLLRLRRQGEL